MGEGHAVCLVASLAMAHREIAVVAPSRLPALAQEGAVDDDTVQDGHVVVAKGATRRVLITRSR
jgi:hypothetical protein